MSRPLEFKRRVRMPDPEEPPMPRAQRSPVIFVGVLSWLAAVAVAWGVSAGTIPVNRWLDGEAEPPRPSAAPARARPRPTAEPMALPRLVAAPPAPSSAFEPVPVAEAEAELGPAADHGPGRGSDAAPARAAEPLAHPEPSPRTNDDAPGRQKAAPANAPRTDAPAPPPAAEAQGPGSSDGRSCEAAAAAYADEIRVGGDRGPADLSAGDYARVLDSGSYLGGCGVPEHARVDVCAAVQNGRAVGVTVRLSPRAPSVERCVASRVRRLSFPSHPRLDVARTRFE
ncbi:MAG: hypothetical protein HYZ29_03805 [Myxococcales bacterium]|nr:hypothetical protein [Myxococcales bacterium]